MSGHTASSYFNEHFSKLLDKFGAFFQFGAFRSSKKLEDVEYVSLGAGLLCPKDLAADFVKEQKEVHERSIAFDLENNTVEEIVIRELYNHECFYTGDWAQLVPLMADYNIGADEVRRLFYKELPNSDL